MIGKYVGIEADILEIAAGRGNIAKYGGQNIPLLLQGISLQRITEVMSILARNEQRMNRVIFALLDNSRPSWYRIASENNLHFSDGAMQSHISCHVGILQEANVNERRKIDREQLRDYAILPLIELGIIERSYHDEGEFIAGHQRANSLNNCYRLDEAFVELLTVDSETLQNEIELWSNQESVRQRAILTAETTALAAQRVESPHHNLIQDAVDVYASRFLDGFEVVFIDVGDGTRVTDDDERDLSAAGLTIQRGDAMPDVLLWNPQTNALWVIEAVVSDGEVDFHKMERMNDYCERHNKSEISYTTVYENWSRCGIRQNSNRNIQPNTYIWIRDDPSKHYLCTSYGIEE